MSGDQPRQPSPNAAGGARTLIVGGSIVAALGVVWFVVSHFAMHTTTGDALGEALGVVLALLVVASIVGAILSGRGTSE